jgi:hypothetical protein
MWVLFIVLFASNGSGSVPIMNTVDFTTQGNCQSAAQTMLQEIPNQQTSLSNGDEGTNGDLAWCVQK